MKMIKKTKVNGKDIYIETITETKDMEVWLDNIDSEITQLTNNIANIQARISILNTKKQEILALG